MATLASIASDKLRMASTAAVPAAPRQRQSLPHMKESFKYAVQGFWNALKQRARKQSGSCMPSLIRRNGHLSSLASWPRLASRISRERSSPKPQPGSSPAAWPYSLSFPGPGLPSASLTVTQARRNYNSNIFKASRQTSASEDSQEELHEGTSTALQNLTPVNPASPDSDAVLWEDHPDTEMQEYLLKGILEVQQRTNCCTAPDMSHGNTWLENLVDDFYCEALMIPCNSEAKHDGAGDSSITTVSENGTASSAASQELQEVAVQGATPRFRGIRQKENKWISEIRPPCSKKTVWLGTYKTQEEAARAYDAGIYYYKKVSIPYNFPDSPKVFQAINEGSKEVSTKFVKTQARKNAGRAWPSGTDQLQTPTSQQQEASSSERPRGWSNACKKRKMNSRCYQ